MYRVAIVGAGGIAAYHADAIGQIDELTLVATCDIVEERAEKMAKPHGARYFTDYTKMCDEVEFDVVILNLPHYMHCETSIYFMERGIHVLVEKPMAMNAEECDRMIAASKKYNVKLAVGHVQKYYSAYKQIKQFIEDGTLGKLCMITETRNTDYTSKGRARWFLTKELSGGGIVMNYCAHSLDKIMFTTGKKVSRVHAMLSNPMSDDNVEVNGHILMRLEDGVSVSITLCGCRVPPDYDVAFYFTEGVAKITNAKNLTVTTGGVTTEYGGTEELFTEQLAELVKLLDGEKSDIVTPQYGREVMRVIDQIYMEEVL